jgi:hypothetical protein
MSLGIILLRIFSSKQPELELLLLLTDMCVLFSLLTPLYELCSYNIYKMSLVWLITRIKVSIQLSLNDITFPDYNTMAL